MKGRTALASRCLRSPLFDEPTLVKRSRKLCGGRRDRGGEEEEEVVGVGEEGGEEEVVQPSPTQSVAAAASAVWRKITAHHTASLSRRIAFIFPESNKESTIIHCVCGVFRAKYNEKV